MRLNEIFEKIRNIIAEMQGVKADKITMDSDLLKDFGIAGDDALLLFEEIDNKFAIDWNNIHLGIHFGNEGLGYPFPWQLKDNCLLFEHQPCSVRDLVFAAESGIWKGTPLVPLPLAARLAVYAFSTVQYLFLAGIALSVIALSIYKFAA